MKIGIAAHFDAAHFLPNHPKCMRVHGHTYRVEVEIEEKNALAIDPLTSETMVLDFHDLKGMVKEVLDELDHGNLNEMFAYPSVENIAQYIFGRLEGMLDEKVGLHSVKVYEGEGKWAQVGGR